MGYPIGWMGEGFICFAWPDGLAKAERAEHIIRRRLEMLGVQAQEIHTEYIGINSLQLALAPQPPDPDLINEVRLRIAIRTQNRADCEKLAREFPPILLSGPPTAAAVAGTPAPRELLGLGSFLIPREEIYPHVQIAVEEVR